MVDIQRSQYYEAISRAFTDYFQDLFSEPQPNLNMDSWEGWSRFDDHLSATHLSWLNKPFTADEMTTAAFQIGGTKAPGPDGFPGCFYHHHWDFIGPSICKAALLKEVNYSHVALIPKVQSLSAPSDYQPISLCNVLYKIISKTLANRLKHILPSYISPTQNAFIQGRQISDSSVLASEFSNLIAKRKRVHKYMVALKLDMSKAFSIYQSAQVWLLTWVFR